MKGAVHPIRSTRPGGHPSRVTPVLAEAQMLATGDPPHVVHGLEDGEFATLDWVSRYNGDRLLEPIGYIPPVEFEAMYHQNQGARVMVAGVN